MAVMMLRDASRAEEVTQDVFLKVWRALPSYDRGASLSTWVYTIARNTCLSAVRSESYRRTTCREVPEYILESFEELPSAAIQAGIDAHLLGCEGCARFARVQRMLDAGLSTMLVPPAMSPVFRLVLRDRIGREATSPRLDALPDIVHFASFGVATLVCTAVLPVSPSAIIGVGTTVALSSYVLLSAARSSFEDAPIDADV